MTREELIEAIARAMAECEPRSLYGDAVAALAAIEAAGVRLVPSDVTEEMLDATMSTGTASNVWQAANIYRAMLAASPYAPPGG